MEINPWDFFYAKQHQKVNSKINLQMSKLSFLRLNYFFFHSFSISSSDFPLVSGTSFHTNQAARIPIAP
jgi:hypothetical protein